MGGVPVNVPREMDYDDNAGKLHIHLKPGHQVLSGYDAMCYVRYRKSNKKGQSETDFERQERQKDMLLGFKTAALSNWTRLPEIAEAGKAVFGNALSDEQLLSLGLFAKEVGPQRIKLGVIPVVDEGNGLRLVASKLPEVLREYKLADDSNDRVSLRQQ
jgi:anionic cell wall polymer biosynthesis LytR-Cps2A-Psr (LCP) family protein